MNREEFLDFLQWDGEESEETWRRVVRQYTQDDIGMEDLYAYRESMKKKYAQKTEISPGVQEWILQHTEGAATREERLRRIEDALSAMEYNKNPGALPDQVAVLCNLQILEMLGIKRKETETLDQTRKEKEKLLELLKQNKGKAYWIYWVRLYMKPSVIQVTEGFP